MKTINYIIKQSAANFGDTTGMDVEASLAHYCDQLEAELTRTCFDMADGYEAVYRVVPVRAESDETITATGPTDECWSEHTDTVEDLIPRAMNDVFDSDAWVVEVAE